MIVDVFAFANEVDVLEVRLNELYDVVDLFIIVEAPYSFMGKPKPLAFQENLSRFERFLPKIQPVIVPDMPNTGDPWENERWQKNKTISESLPKLGKGDWIIACDADEIPRADIVDMVANGGFYSGDLWDCPVTLNMPFYWYWFNVEANTPQSSLPKIIPGDQWEDFMVWRDRDCPAIPDAGWHFTSLGGKEVGIWKAENFSHAPEKDCIFYAGKMRGNDGDLLEFHNEIAKPDGQLKEARVDSYFPQWIQDNKQSLWEKGLIRAEKYAL